MITAFIKSISELKVEGYVAIPKTPLLKEILKIPTHSGIIFLKSVEDIKKNMPNFFDNIKFITLNDIIYNDYVIVGFYNQSEEECTKEIREFIRATCKILNNLSFVDEIYEWTKKNKRSAMILLYDDEEDKSSLYNFGAGTNIMLANLMKDNSNTGLLSYIKNASTYMLNMMKNFSDNSSIDN